MTNPLLYYSTTRHYGGRSLCLLSRRDDWAEILVTTRTTRRSLKSSSSSSAASSSADDNKSSSSSSSLAVTADNKNDDDNHGYTPNNNNDSNNNNSSAAAATNWQQLQEAMEEITGVHEIAALKQRVDAASDELNQATDRLQQLRQRLDAQTADHQHLNARYGEMMGRRDAWTDEDVRAFAQLTADEARARTAVENTRRAVVDAEETWHAAQTRYLDALRTRYHEEQSHQDRWRVLGTYWTWALIALNSLVFVAGQALHYRRETRRMQTLHEMIRPLTEAAQWELHQHEVLSAEQQQQKATAMVNKDDEDDDENDDDDATQIAMQHHRQLWNRVLDQWINSTVALGRQTIRLLSAQGASAVETGQTVTRRVVVQPTTYAVTEVRRRFAAATTTTEATHDDLHVVHWPSALMGATVAATAIVLVSVLGRSRP